MIKPLRSLINSSSKKLVETVKWGNACWICEDLPAVYIYSGKDHVQLGFFAGSLVKDPKGLLEGKGKFVRFISVRTKKDIDNTAITKMIKQVIKIKYR